VRAVLLHPDVIVVTSAVLQVNCVIVRGGDGTRPEDLDGPRHAGRSADLRKPEQPAETFVIDSLVLPDEIDALPSLIEQARFPAPSGLLATHGDWDHLLGRLAFPRVPLGCAESTAERLAASPGEVQRQLRVFDEELMIERPRPLVLGSVQALPVPGRCGIGDRELELYPGAGHTPDGMIIVARWAGVLTIGDHLSSIEIPTLNDGGEIDTYLATLERLRGLIPQAQHVVPGHGPVLNSDRALTLLEEDACYLRALAEHGVEAELPAGRRKVANRRWHSQNVRGS
jgi:glyoxylase-like metal-dependent hydrolase (beta-lactamase superfamily II)